jgi:predicted transport protein
MAEIDKQLATMLANLPEKTGKPLADWLVLLGKERFEKHGQIVKFLKGEHGVTHGFANLIAAKALENNEPQDLVADQYSGAKADLRPIHDVLVDYAKSLGDDVEIAPKKSSVSLRRKKQFALITPATKTRIDLGLALKGEEAAGRLENYNAMCSHRVRIEASTDIDEEVRSWIAEAYNRAG